LRLKSEGFLRLKAPTVRCDPGVECGPPARPGVPGLPTSVPLHRDLYVETREGAHVSNESPVGAKNLHRPLFAGQRGHDLHHSRIPIPTPGVDFLEQGDLGLEARGLGRIDILVEPGVRRPGAFVGHAGVSPASQRGGGRRALERRLGYLAGVGVPGGFARHDTKTEAVRGIERCGFQASVVVQKGLASGALEENLPVIGVSDRLSKPPGRVT